MFVHIFMYLGFMHWTCLNIICSATPYIAEYLSEHYGEVRFFLRDLPSTLLEVVNSESDDLVQHSLLLLERHYSIKNLIIQGGQRVRLLMTAKSKELHEEIL